MKEIESTNETDNSVVFPENEYHFYKDFAQERFFHTSNTDSLKNYKKYVSMLIENKKNLVIDGCGSRFIIHGDIMSFGVFNCENITLKNFTLDYANPSNIELHVKDIKGSGVIYEIPEFNLWYLDKRKFTFFEQSRFTKKNYWEFKNCNDSWCSVCHRNNYVFRVPNILGPFAFIRSAKRLSQTEVCVNYFKKPKCKTGDIFTCSPNKNRNTCGAFFNESKNLVVENANINYLHGFGWLSQMCENITFFNCKFEPAENKTVSSFADSIHVSGAKGKILINKCSFSHSHDDSINIHGTFLSVAEKLPQNKLLLEYKHNQTAGFCQYHKGDKVIFYKSSDLSEQFENTVKSVVNPMENNLSERQTIVEFEKPFSNNDFSSGKYVAENASYCPDVEICNCRFNAIPTRGILCTSRGKVKIHDNDFSNVLMANIFISNDCSEWYESGPVRDVEIYNNNFKINKTDNLEWKHTPAIYFYPITKGKLKAPVHENVYIHDNCFDVGSNYSVYAIGVRNIKLKNNKYSENKNKFSVCENISEE